MNRHLFIALTHFETLNPFTEGHFPIHPSWASLQSKCVCSAFYFYTSISVTLNLYFSICLLFFQLDRQVCHVTCHCVAEYGTVSHMGS